MATSRNWPGTSCRPRWLASPGEGSSDLIAFANRHTIDSGLRHRAVLLQLEYYKAETPEEKAAALGEMAELVDDTGAGAGRRTRGARRVRPAPAFPAAP